MFRWLNLVPIHVTQVQLMYYWWRSWLDIVEVSQRRNNYRPISFIQKTSNALIKLLRYRKCTVYGMRVLRKACGGWEKAGWNARSKRRGPGFGGQSAPRMCGEWTVQRRGGPTCTARAGTGPDHHLVGTLQSVFVTAITCLLKYPNYDPLMLIWRRLNHHNEDWKFTDT